MRIWSFLVLVVLVSVVGGMAQASLSLSNHQRAEATWRPLERERAPGFRPPRACPRQLVWIVFDGLRLDVSRELLFLNELRARGVDASATVPLPSLSRPSYTTMATGAPPAWSGVRNNSFSGPAPLDSVFDRAHEANRSVQARANLAWWNDLFGRGFSSFELRALGALGQRSAPTCWKATSNAAIVLIHVVDLDRIGHSSGVRDEYRRRARGSTTSSGAASPTWTRRVTSCSSRPITVTGIAAGTAGPSRRSCKCRWSSLASELGAAS
ncbi:MAG: alkaline phosphatase family protein [Polyangiaceae bacterium]